MKSKTEKMPFGGKVEINSNGEKTFDLNSSYDILSDMNHIIKRQVNKLGSSVGATQWFYDAIRVGQIELPERHDVTTNIMTVKSNKVSPGYFQLPGRMFAFKYNPKSKQDLDYYDITPLIITMPRDVKRKEEGKGGASKGIDDTILGINLHYLEPDLRAELLDRLLKISSGKGKKEWKPPKGIGYFRLEYEMLKSMRFIYGLPCIRSYSLTRIVGRPALIPSNQWANAVALPFENFIKEKYRRVWLENRLLIKEFIKQLGEME